MLRRSDPLSVALPLLQLHCGRSITFPILQSLNLSFREGTFCRHQTFCGARQITGLLLDSREFGTVTVTNRFSLLSRAVAVAAGAFHFAKPFVCAKRWLFPAHARRIVAFGDNQPSQSLWVLMGVSTDTADECASDWSLGFPKVPGCRSATGAGVLDFVNTWEAARLRLHLLLMCGPVRPSQ